MRTLNLSILSCIFLTFPARRDVEPYLDRDFNHIPSQANRSPASGNAYPKPMVATFRALVGLGTVSLKFWPSPASAAR